MRLASGSELSATLAAEATVPSAGIHGVLAESLAFTPPSTPGTGPILIVAAAYAVVVLMALRFGGIPGAAASLALAALASVAEWASVAEVADA